MLTNIYTTNALLFLSGSPTFKSSIGIFPKGSTLARSALWLLAATWALCLLTTAHPTWWGYLTGPWVSLCSVSVGYCGAFLGSCHSLSLNGHHFVILNKHHHYRHRHHHRHSIRIQMVPYLHHYHLWWLMQKMQVETGLAFIPLWRKARGSQWRGQQGRCVDSCRGQRWWPSWSINSPTHGDSTFY